MSRPTPETDAQGFGDGRHPWVSTKFARKLERERDEARELIDDIWITSTSDHRFIMPPSKKQIPQHIEGIIKAYDKAHDDWTPEEIKNLMRERDEALMDRARGETVTMTINHYERILRERDEAREVLREIWQSGDAFLPYVDEETTTRWRKAAGWEEK